MISCIGGTQTLHPLDNDTIDAFCTANGPIEPEIIQYPSHAQVSVTGAANDVFNFQFGDGKLVTNGVYSYLMRYKPKTADPTGKPVVKRGTITVL